MAVLLATQLAEIRQKVAADIQAGDNPVRWDKPQINAAIQAVEDRFEEIRASISTAINTASSPLGITFNGPEKIATVKHWLLQKHGRE